MSTESSRKWQKAHREQWLAYRREYAKRPAVKKRIKEYNEKRPEYLISKQLFFQHQAYQRIYTKEREHYLKQLPPELLIKELGL